MVCVIHLTSKITRGSCSMKMHKSRLHCKKLKPYRLSLGHLTTEVYEDKGISLTAGSGSNSSSSSSNGSSSSSNRSSSSSNSSNCSSSSSSSSSSGINTELWRWFARCSDDVAAAAAYATTLILLL